MDARLQQQGKLYFCLVSPLSTRSIKLEAFLSPLIAQGLTVLLGFDVLCCWPPGCRRQPPREAAEDGGLLWPGRLLSLGLHAGSILPCSPGILVLHATLQLPECALFNAGTRYSHALLGTARPSVVTALARLNEAGKEATTKQYAAGACHRIFSKCKSLQEVVHDLNQEGGEGGLVIVRCLSRAA